LVADINTGVSFVTSADAKLSMVSAIELAIELSADEATSGRITLRAADVDTLIASLANSRSAMTHEVPRMLLESTSVCKVIDPNWIVHSPATTKDKLLIFRHPGLGWIMFQLPASEAARLGHALLSAAPRQIADQPLSGGRLH
jgi:hypothetical protein